MGRRRRHNVLFAGKYRSTINFFRCVEPARNSWSSKSNNLFSVQKLLMVIGMSRTSSTQISPGYSARWFELRKVPN